MMGNLELDCTEVAKNSEAKKIQFLKNTDINKNLNIVTKDDENRLVRNLGPLERFKIYLMVQYNCFDFVFGA